MRKPRQIVMHCPCGNAKVLGKGLCATCYTLKRQDEAYFGGHRESVLKRDEYRCRVPDCTTVKRGKRSVAVHHREPGNSDPAKMITLCLGCHAKVTRTLYLESDWPEFPPGAWERAAPDWPGAGALELRRRSHHCKAADGIQHYGGDGGKPQLTTRIGSIEKRSYVTLSQTSSM